MGVGGNKLGYVLLTILILFGVALVYGIHYIDYSKCDGCVSKLYPYPIHGDEWVHLALGMSIMENGAISNSNPYIVSQGYKDLESGFHVFIAQFFTLTGLDPVMNEQFLPALLVAICILGITLYLYHITKNIYIGLLAGLFFLSIKGNINIYGLWFFVPIIFSIFLIFMFFYTYLRGDTKLLSVIFFLATIVVYPIATVFITSILAIYLLYNKKIKLKYLYCLFALIFLSVILIGFSRLKDYIVFMSGWTLGFEVEYSLIQTYGVISTLFAAVGIYFLFRKKYDKIILMALIIPAFSMACYAVFGATLLIPYQRAFFYMMISMVPLSAIGVYHTLEFIFAKVKNKTLSISIISVITLILLAGLFYNYYYIPDKRFVPQHIISDADYNALSWIKTNVGTNYTLIIPGTLAFGVYPLSHNTVFAMPGSSLQSRNLSVVYSFYASECDAKEYLLLHFPRRPELTHRKIIYSLEPINCSFMKNIYTKDGVYLYLTNSTR